MHEQQRDTPDDRALLLAMRRGSERAARDLWNRHAPAMTVHAATILSHDYAPDAVQAVFCRILQMRTRELARVDNPAAWLHSLVRNQALNMLREDRRRYRRHSASAPLRAATPNARAEFNDNAPSADALAQAVDSLPARMREAVVLRHFAGLNFDQLAVAVGVPRSTAASRYRAALSRLRQLLTPTGNDPALAHTENHPPAAPGRPAARDER